MINSVHDDTAEVLYQYLARKVRARILRDHTFIEKLIDDVVYGYLVHLYEDEFFVKDAALEVRISPRLGFYILLSTYVHKRRVYKINLFPVDLKTGNVLTTSIVDHIFTLNSSEFHSKAGVSVDPDGGVVLPDEGVLNSLSRAMTSPRLKILLDHEHVYTYVIDALNRAGISAFFDPLNDYKLIAGPNALQANMVKLNLEFEPYMKRLKATAIRGSVKGNLRLVLDRPVSFDLETRPVEEVARNLFHQLNAFNSTLVFDSREEARNMKTILNKHSDAWDLEPFVDSLMSAVSFSRGTDTIDAFFGPGYLYKINRVSSAYIRVQSEANLKPVLKRFENALNRRLPKGFESRVELENEHTLTVDASPAPGGITLPADQLGKRNVFLDDIVYPVWSAFSKAVGDVL